MGIAAWDVAMTRILYTNVITRNAARPALNFADPADARSSNS